MSKWKTAIHTIKRTFMCCIRCTDIIDRMTRTATEEMEANQTTRPPEDRKASIAKIIITSADNEEHIEFSQPITIQYMGNVQIHSETNYYTPNITPRNSREDLGVYTQRFFSAPQLENRIKRRTLPAMQGDALNKSILRQVMEQENNPNNIIVPVL